MKVKAYSGEVAYENGKYAVVVKPKSDDRYFISVHEIDDCTLEPEYDATVNVVSEKGWFVTDSDKWYNPATWGPSLEQGVRHAKTVADELKRTKPRRERAEESRRQELREQLQRM